MTRDNIVGTLHGDDHVEGDLSVGGGVSSYTELEDLPTLNGETIIGNMSIWQPKNFSETEQNTGLKWFDGKDIYVKCYQTTIDDANNKYVDNTLTKDNINVLPMSCVNIFAKGIYNTWLTWNCYTDCILRIICNNIGVAINCENYNYSNFGTSDVYTVLYYTKIS